MPIHQKEHEKLNQSQYTLRSKDHAQFRLKSTLYLAYRDLPKLLNQYFDPKHTRKFCRFLDFGCGAGLSTEVVIKILKGQGYDVESTGIDINAQNIALAQARLSNTNFIQMSEDAQALPKHLGKFDLIFCNFVLLEHPESKMLELLKLIHSVLDENGVVFITNCTAKTYNPSKKWYTFASYMETPEHGKFKLTEDQPVTLSVWHNKGAIFTFSDFFHSGKSYKAAYEKAGFTLLSTQKPLGTPEDELPWRSELQDPPYKIHILQKNSEAFTNTNNLAVSPLKAKL